MYLRTLMQNINVNDPFSPPSVFQTFDQPRIIRGNISYTIDGRGKTNSGTMEFDTEKVFVISFESMAEANNYYLPLKYFSKNEHITKVRYINRIEDEQLEEAGRIHVLVEKFDMNLRSFIVKKGIEDTTYTQWSRSSQSYFFTIFSGLLSIFDHVFSSKKKQFKFPSLLGVLSVNDQGTPKITYLTSLAGNIYVDRTPELRDLARTMVIFLTGGACDSVKNWEDLHHARPDILRLVEDLVNWKYENRVPTEWLLDSSVFWDADTTEAWIKVVVIQAARWVRKESFDEKLIKRLDGSLKRYLRHGEWKNYLPNEKMVQDVLHTYLKDKARKKSSSVRNVQFVFYDVVKFYQNMFVHYKDRNKTLICNKVESIFPPYGLRYILRDVMRDAFFKDQPKGRDSRWSQFLTCKI